MHSSTASPSAPHTPATGTPSPESPRWLAATTRYNQELALRRAFEREGVECFIPSKRTVRRFGARMCETEAALIPNLVFVRTVWREAFRLQRLHAAKMSYVRGGDRRILEIPDAQMEAFVRMVGAMAEEVTLRSASFAPGDRVIVRSGPLAGQRGELVEVDGRREFLVRIPGLLAASVKINRNNIIRAE